MPETSRAIELCYGTLAIDLGPSIGPRLDSTVTSVTNKQTSLILKLPHPEKIQTGRFFIQAKVLAYARNCALQLMHEEAILIELRPKLGMEINAKAI